MNSRMGAQVSLKSLNTRLSTACVVTVIAWLALAAGTALGAEPAPGWTIDEMAVPANFSSTHNGVCAENVLRCDSYNVTAVNAGSRGTDGTNLKFKVSVALNVKVEEIQLLWSGAERLASLSPAFEGLEPLTDLQAALGAKGIELCHIEPEGVGCELLGGLFKILPRDTLRLRVYVSVQPGATEALASSADISGGGAAPASTQISTPNTEALPTFGYTFSGLFSGPDGAAATQAGGHPIGVSTRIDLNSTLIENEERSVNEIRDVDVDLPTGMVGSAIAAPTCALAVIAAGNCPPDTVIGHVKTEPQNNASVEGPMYNVTPETGVPAEFGFIDNLKGVHILYANVAPTPSGYTLRVSSSDIPQDGFTNIVVDFYGDPAAVDGTGGTEIPQLTSPASCNGQTLTTTMHIDRWIAPGSYNADGTPNFADLNWIEHNSIQAPMTGCNRLRFNPAIGGGPESQSANSPTGFDVDVEVPEHESPSTLATPPLRDAVVTLPAGLTVNPSSANGLSACSLAQVGMSESGVPNAFPPSCPKASRIGSLEVESPAIAGVLQGSVYLARQDENPFHSLLALYFIVDDRTRGVLVKLAGRVEADPNTGQITTTVENSPQLPFSDLRVHVFGGQESSLRTPGTCGSYAVESVLTPWSAPDSGPPASPERVFGITSGSEEGPCKSSFSPSFAVGTSSNEAKGFSPMTVLLSRQDKDESLSGLTVTTPPGVLGDIKSIERCGEAAANAGTCSVGSLIGHATVGAGTGKSPFYIQDGRVYLTGPYKGAPFGLSIVVPAIAGPFNLGTVVVRAAIEVDPDTAQIHVVSDSIPQMINSVEGLRSGIPTDLRSIAVTVDRPRFTFNATNCDPLAGSATVTSIGGTVTSVASRYQASNCSALTFTPQFRATVRGKASKRNGVSLAFTMSSGDKQANLSKVHLAFPQQLPSRQSTLSKACLSGTFEKNPASCGAESVIGTATVHTPILAAPLSGPIYLVARGGAKFPDVVMVLQGEGVTIDVVSHTLIHHGVTSSSFETVPDAPFSIFEAILPAGPHSIFGLALAKRGDFNVCGHNLRIPTTLTAQDGAVVKQSTKLAVTGCVKKGPERSKSSRQDRTGR